jgi:hypothetical protein
MRILKEDTDIKNEVLPLPFLTDMVSKGWEEVGYLKEASAAIGTEYTNTDKVQQIMQDLIDAYLVFLGQLEAHLHNEDYIEEPDTDNAKDDKEEDEEEDTKTDAEKSAKDVEEPEVEIDEDDEEEIPEAKIDPELLAVQDKPAVAPVTMNSDFDFFVDFDEPDMSQPRLTDDELYGHEDSEYEQARLRSMLN